LLDGRRDRSSTIRRERNHAGIWRRAPDSAYAEVRDHFTEKESADLSDGFALMNAFHRLEIGFRQPPAA
jgi:hypothetical protein